MEREKELRARIGTKGCQVEMVIENTALTFAQHKEYLMMGWLPRKYRDWQPTHKRVWTWAGHTTRQGWFTLVHEDEHLVKLDESEEDQ